MAEGGLRPCGLQHKSSPLPDVPGALEVAAPPGWDVLETGSALLPSGRSRTRRGGASPEGAVARADGRLPGPMGAAAVARPPRRAPSPGRQTPPSPPFPGCCTRLRGCGVQAVPPARCRPGEAPHPRPSAPPAGPQPSFLVPSRARGRLKLQVCGCVSGRGQRERTLGRQASAVRDCPAGGWVALRLCLVVFGRISSKERKPTGRPAPSRSMGARPHPSWRLGAPDLGRVAPCPPDVRGRGQPLWREQVCRGRGAF